MPAAGRARAQSAPSVEELSALRANPLSGLRNLTLQYQHNFDYPSAGHSQPAPSLQVVWPWAVTKDWTVVTQTSVPALSQVDGAGDHRAYGLSDTLVTAAITPEDTGAVIWGVGAALELPTATDADLGSDLWAAGPALGLYTQPGNWTIGGLFENVWSFAGAGNTPVNTFNLQYNVNYNLPRGWFVESATTITADWKAGATDRWTVPVGLGVGRVFTLGTRSLSLATESFYNVVRPSAGPDWSLSLAVQLIFPD